MRFLSKWFSKLIERMIYNWLDHERSVEHMEQVSRHGRNQHIDADR